MIDVSILYIMLGQEQYNLLKKYICLDECEYVSDIVKELYLSKNFHTDQRDIINLLNLLER